MDKLNFMKKIASIYFICCVLLTLTTNFSIAQCNTTDLTKTCINNIQEGFIFIKNFPVDGQNGQKEKLEYSYIFAKDTEYSLNLCTAEEIPDGIIVTISDSKRREIASNYANEKFYPGIIFQCKMTGIYYITYSFEKSESDCAGSVLAFKKM